MAQSIMRSEKEHAQQLVGVTLIGYDCEKKIAFSLFDIMTKNTAKVVVKDKYIKKKSLKLSCSLSIFCSPASQSRLGTWE